MVEIRNVVKGANVIEGIIFDQSHRNVENYKKFISKVL